MIYAPSVDLILNALEGQLSSYVKVVGKELSDRMGGVFVFLDMQMQPVRELGSTTMKGAHEVTSFVQKERS